MPNTRTPAHLVQRFGLQPEYPPAKISGVWFGFRAHAPGDEDAKRPKKEFLAVHLALEFLGGIKLHVGGDANWEKRIPGVELARFMSVDVSTACRRIGMFTPEDGRWDEERRRKMSEREKEKARALKERKEIPAWTDALRKAFQEHGTLTSAAIADVAGVPHSRGIQCARQWGFNLVAEGFAPAQSKRGSKPKLYRLSDEPPKLKARAMRSVQRVKQTMNKNAGYGQAQFYTLHMPDELKPRLEEGRQQPSPTANVERMAEAFGPDWFDPEQEGINNYKWAPGYIKDLPRVKKCICQMGQLCLLPGNTCPLCDNFGAIGVRDERGELVPLYDNGKTLFFFLILKGLIDHGSIDNQRLVQEMEPALGMDQATIAEFRDQLQLLKIIRKRTGDIMRLCMRCDVRFICRWRDNKDGEGKWVGQCSKCGTTAGTVVRRWPDVWIHIADKVMDEETVERERQRFQDLRVKVEAAAFARAEQAHTELLLAWRGREHSLMAFFKEMRRRLASLGLTKNVINVLFPFFRE